MSVVKVLCQVEIAAVSAPEIVPSHLRASAAVVIPAAASAVSVER